MIEIKLIPDGAAEIPEEASDHGILASLLENNANPSSNSAMASWREIERVVPGHRGYIKLQLPGTLEDESSSTRDGVTTAIVNNISGLKEHPDGWVEIEE
jgi:hypothetical protein